MPAYQVPAFNPEAVAMPTGGFLFYDSNIPNVIGSQVVNSYTALSIPSYYRAMSFIARNMASFERSIEFNGVGNSTHKLSRLISRAPNNYQSAYLLWHTLFFQAAHYSAGYLEIQRDSNYTPIALHNRRYEFVMPFRWLQDDGTVSTYYYVGGSRPHVCLFVDMVHLHGGLSLDGLGCINPVFLGQDVLDRAKLADQFVTRYLRKGSLLRGAIQIPHGVDPKRQEVMRKTLREHFSAPDGDDIIVLSEGAELKNSTLSNSDSQLVELAGHITRQVGQWVSVPPQFLFDLSEAKYSDNLETLWAVVVRDLFDPMAMQISDELSSKLLSEADLAKGYKVQFDTSRLIRGTITTESEAAIAEKTAGLRTANEARQEIGLPPSTDPTANTLQTLGSSLPPPKQPAETQPTGQQPAAQQPAPVQPSEVKASKGYAHLAPIIGAAIERVEQKTSKAFAGHEAKDNKVIWSNVFAAQQAQYVRECLAPINETLEAMGLDPLPISDIAEKYAAQIRKQAATNEAANLKKIIEV